MCGICGQYNFQDPKPVAPACGQGDGRIRSPIGARTTTGISFPARLGLGFRRLSIIDLAGGHQPMSDQEESIWVVFNGEIYNFPELRRELEALGHAFRTRSDTEVIIHGYKQWGSEVLNRLNGMFGLAIWDDRRKKLILARDAAGIKMIYYKVDSGSVWFGSEIRAVLAALPGRPEVDMTALNLFLRYRYTPSPLTLYKGIRKLAAGTMAVFENGAWSVERWYQFRPQPFSPARSDAEATEELLDVYKRALKRHLISDVPVGLLLSGGVDSGLLLGLMSLYGDAWHTYTVGYGKSAYKDDELADAAETAAIFSVAERAGRAQPGHLRTIAPQDRLRARGADCRVLHRADVFRLRARTAGREGRAHGAGPGRAVRRLQASSRHSVRGLLEERARAGCGQGLEAGIRRLPRNETLKRGVYSLEHRRPDAALPERVFDHAGR